MMHEINWISTEDAFEHCAEFGLVFLLFTLGLEFSLPRLLDLKKTVIGLGSLQFIAVTLSIFIVLFYIGLPFVTAMVCAMGLSFSSTAIIVKELKRRDKLTTESGERIVAILLFQDLMAMAVLLILPCIPSGNGEMILRGLLLAFIKGSLLFSFLMAVGKWILPRVLNEISAAKSDELFVVVTLVISLAAAWLTDKLGLSMALGGFMIGMMMAESKHAHHVEQEIRPFRDLLLGVFFVSIGMKVNLSLVLNEWRDIMLFAAVMILIKTLSMFLVMIFKRYSFFKSLELSLFLSQGGEFGFAVLSLATSFQLINERGASQYLSVIIMSMAFSPLIFYTLNKLAPRAKV